MSASIAGTHVLTVGDVKEMLSRFNDHDRVVVLEDEHLEEENPHLVLEVMRHDTYAAIRIDGNPTREKIDAQQSTVEAQDALKELKGKIFEIADDDTKNISDRLEDIRTEVM